MSPLVNFVLFQLGWFACVHFGPGTWPTASLAPLITVVIVALHVRAVRRGRRAAYAGFCAAIGALGWALDSGLEALAVTGYAGRAAAGAPLWIACLWVLFATTLHHSLTWLRGRWLLAVAFGAVGGPLAFFSGVSLGATVVPEDPLRSALGLGLEYALLTPLLVAAGRRWPRDLQPA